MAKNQVGMGTTKRVGPFTTGHNSGDILVDGGWPGIVVADIIGTTEPLIAGPGGKALSGQFGDGLGDIDLEGEYKLVDESGGALADGDRVKRSSPSGVIKSATASATDVGHVLGAPYTEAVGDETVAFVNVKLLGRPNPAL